MRVIRVLARLSVVPLALLMVPVTARAVFTYSVDDGTAENSVGLAATGDLWWANQFNAVPGFDVIQAVEVAFGSPPPGVSIPDGVPVTLAIYDDVDNDGLPNDLALLATVMTTTQLVGTNMFVTVPVPLTAVNDSFFVAALISITPTQTPAAIDEDSDLGQSWVTAATGGGSINIADPLGTNTVGGIFTTAQIGVPGNWLLRVQATPEPATWLLILVGGGLGAARRRRKKLGDPLGT